MAASSPAKSNSGATDVAASPSVLPSSKSLRGLNKPECIKCGNVARSRCPYQSCKNCCAKAQNPCHIHVLEGNSSFPDRPPSANTPLYDQQSSEVSHPGVGASSGSCSSSILKNGSKKCSASIGTVSHVIGTGYFNPRPQSKRLNEKLKPVILNSDDFPVTEIWGEEKESSPLAAQGPPMDDELGEFIYKMLGKGFQLEMCVIKEVIGQCGYNMSTSIEKLLEMSAATLEKSDDVIGIAAGNNTKNSHDVGSTSCPKQSQLHYSGRSNSDAGRGDESVLPQTKITREDMQRDVLEALFSVPDRFPNHHDSTRPVRKLGQSSYGRIVAKPLKESIIEDFTFITRQPINDRNNEANEESYDELRKAVQENWVTMKEYFKASVDAFGKRDYETAQNLLEKGNFYMGKAREADEKSTQNLTKNSNEDEEICINVHLLEPKEAMHHMRLHLTSLCGLPSIRFMKVVVGTGEDKKDGRRKRRMIKLLEEEGIPWTEEGNGWIFSLRVDVIDPNKFSFRTKEQPSDSF